jgi:hypothetical protein
MTIFKKSVKVVMTKEDILNLKLKRGIDVTFTPVKFNSSIYVATFSATDLNPSNPLEECEASDIDEAIAKLNVFSDRIRTTEDLAKVPKTARQVDMHLGDPLLDPNKYDFLRSKAKNLKDNGFATIQEG